MKLNLTLRYLLFLLSFTLASVLSGQASDAGTPATTIPPIDPGLIQPLLDGLLGKYGWLTTVLLVVGSLRILFKPIMLVIENAVKNDPAKADAIQRFEAGPIYKAIATVLDLGASIKLPLVKPPAAPKGDGK